MSDYVIFPLREEKIYFLLELQLLPGRCSREPNYYDPSRQQSADNWQQSAGNKQQLRPQKCSTNYEVSGISYLKRCEFPQFQQIWNLIKKHCVNRKKNRLPNQAEPTQYCQRRIWRHYSSLRVCAVGSKKFCRANLPYNVNFAYLNIINHNWVLVGNYFKVRKTL